MARILIIEDEEDLALLYRLVLEKHGHEVVGTLDDPRDAIRRAGENPALPIPDVLILDERLGGVSGTAFLPGLRQAFPNMRVLLATADPEVASKARDLGADEVQRKPFDVETLMATVEALAANGRSESGLE